MRLHFVSTGPRFPYAYYIGVMTALRSQAVPVTLWLTETPQEQRYFDLLPGKVEVRQITTTPVFPALRGKDSHSKRVAIFDYTVWRIVSEYGGVIMGLDSITLGSWQELLESDKEMLVPVDNDHNGNLSMHGVVVRLGSEIARAIHQASLEALQAQPDDFTFGSAGILPYRRIVAENLGRVTQVGHRLVGGFGAKAEPYWLEDREAPLNPDTRTIPLYGTAIGSVDTIDEAFVRRGDTLYARLVQRVLSREEWEPFDYPKFRFHMLGLAHIPTSREFRPCAYSQKVVKMGTMLKSLGHTVYFYGGEGSDLDCDESVQVVSNQDRIDCYGDYDWKTEFFKLSGTDSCHKTFNENAIREINARKEYGDLVLCPMGWWHKPITDAVNLAAIESGIGYRGVFAKYRVFESYAWMHYIYGRRKQDDGSYYDAVIPNYYDPVDFPYQEKKDDYFLYLGRLVRRKGIQVAVGVTRELGAKLIVAGQGSLVNPDEKLNITDAHVEHVGTVGPEERAELMGHARAVFVPTLYIEPFGGTAVEAMMCGTPVLAADWGAMSETVLPQVTGFRCRTFGEFVWAARNAGKIKPADCRRWAIENYSMDRVKWQYQAYFEQVKDLWGDGWYNPRHRGISRYQRFRRLGATL